MGGTTSIAVNARVSLDRVLQHAVCDRLSVEASNTHSDYVILLRNRSSVIRRGLMKVERQTDGHTYAVHDVLNGVRLDLVAY